jgi:hypothetical protein
VKKEYVKITTSILNRELSSKNKTKSTGTLAVLRCGFGTVKWH